MVIGEYGVWTNIVSSVDKADGAFTIGSGNKAVYQALLEIFLNKKVIIEKRINRHKMG